MTKPVPMPDLSALDAQARKQVEDVRAEFEKAKVGMDTSTLPDAYATLGGVYTRYELYAAAQIAFENAINLRPEEGRYAYLLGFLYLIQNNSEAALAQFEEAVKAETEYWPAHYRVAELSLAKKNPARAIAVLTPLLSKPVNVAAVHSNLAAAAIQQQQYAKAVTHFETALKAEPSASAMYQPLARALDALGKKTEAAQATAKVGEGQVMYDDPLGASLVAPTRLSKEESVVHAQRLIAVGDFDSARNILNLAMETAPSEVELLRTYVQLEVVAGQLEAAKSHAAAIDKMATGSAISLVTQGFLQEVQGRDVQAKPLYEAALKKDAKQADAITLLGNMAMRQKQFAEAIKHYDQLLQADPDSRDGLARYIAASALAGRCEQALAKVNEDLKKAPKDGFRIEMFVRITVTCAKSSVEEKNMALDYAGDLYKQQPTITHSEALALALNANGKFDDAFDYQAQAIFEAVKRNDIVTRDFLKQNLDAIKNRQAIKLPWAPSHPLFLAPAQKLGQ